MKGEKIRRMKIIDTFKTSLNQFKVLLSHFIIIKCVIKLYFHLIELSLWYWKALSICKIVQWTCTAQCHTTALPYVETKWNIIKYVPDIELWKENQPLCQVQEHFWATFASHSTCAFLHPVSDVLSVI